MRDTETSERVLESRISEMMMECDVMRCMWCAQELTEEERWMGDSRGDPLRLVAMRWV